MVDFFLIITLLTFILAEVFPKIARKRKSKKVATIALDQPFREKLLCYYKKQMEKLSDTI